MRAITRLYTLGVLWLLSVVGRDAVEAIYRHGHDDGANELRAFMRKELQAVQDAVVQDRARAYQAGFDDGMRVRTFDAQVTPSTWRVPPSRSAS